MNKNLKKIFIFGGLACLLGIASLVSYAQIDGGISVEGIDNAIQNIRTIYFSEGGVRPEDPSKQIKVEISDNGMVTIYGNVIMETEEKSNMLGTGLSGSLIVQGNDNFNNGENSVIFGGETNFIEGGVSRGTIFGGYSNEITSGVNSSIFGGNRVLISSGSNSVILSSDQSSLSGNRNLIGGGSQVYVNGNNIFAAGNLIGNSDMSGSGYDNVFIWSDALIRRGSNRMFTPTTGDVFLLRTAGGLSIGYSDGRTIDDSADGKGGMNLNGAMQLVAEPVACNSNTAGAVQYIGAYSSGASGSWTGYWDRYYTEGYTGYWTGYYGYYQTYGWTGRDVYGWTGHWDYRYTGSWVYGYTGHWVYGYTGYWTYGYTGAWVYGYTGHWVYGYGWYTGYGWTGHTEYGYTGYWTGYYGWHHLYGYTGYWTGYWSGGHRHEYYWTGYTGWDRYGYTGYWTYGWTGYWTGYYGYYQAYGWTGLYWTGYTGWHYDYIYTGYKAYGYTNYWTGYTGMYWSGHHEYYWTGYTGWYWSGYYDYYWTYGYTGHMVYGWTGYWTYGYTGLHFVAGPSVGGCFCTCNGEEWVSMIPNDSCYDLCKVKILEVGKCNPDYENRYVKQVYDEGACAGGELLDGKTRYDYSTKTWTWGCSGAGGVVQCKAYLKEDVSCGTTRNTCTPSFGTTAYRAIDHGYTWNCLDQEHAVVGDACGYCEGNYVFNKASRKCEAKRCGDYMNTCLPSSNAATDISYIPNGSKWKCPKSDSEKINCVKCYDGYKWNESTQTCSANVALIPGYCVGGPAISDGVTYRGKSTFAYISGDTLSGVLITGSVNNGILAQGSSVSTSYWNRIGPSWDRGGLLLSGGYLSGERWSSTGVQVIKYWTYDPYGNSSVCGFSCAQGYEFSGANWSGMNWVDGYYTTNGYYTGGYTETYWTGNFYSGWFLTGGYKTGGYYVPPQTTSGHWAGGYYGYYWVYGYTGHYENGYRRYRVEEYTGYWTGCYSGGMRTSCYLTGYTGHWDYGWTSYWTGYYTGWYEYGWTGQYWVPGTYKPGYWTGEYWTGEYWTGEWVPWGKYTRYVPRTWVSYRGYVPGHYDNGVYLSGSCNRVIITETKSCGGTKPTAYGYKYGPSTFKRLNIENFTKTWTYVDGNPGECEYTCNVGYTWVPEINKCISKSNLYCGEKPGNSNGYKWGYGTTSGDLLTGYNLSGLELSGYAYNSGFFIKEWRYVYTDHPDMCEFTCQNGYNYIQSTKKCDNRAVKANCVNIVKPTPESHYIFGQSWFWTTVGSLSATPWHYQAGLHPDACAFSCARGYTINNLSNPTQCVPVESVRCKGSAPNNRYRNFIIGENGTGSLGSGYTFTGEIYSGGIVEKNWGYVNTKEVSVCEYTCADGYEWDGRTCTEISAQRSCGGQPSPTSYYTFGKGTYTYYPARGNTKNWTYRNSWNLGECEYRCSGSAYWNGSRCVANPVEEWRSCGSSGWMNSYYRAGSGVYYYTGYSKGWSYTGNYYPGNCEFTCDSSAYWDGGSCQPRGGGVLPPSDSVVHRTSVTSTGGLTYGTLSWSGYTLLDRNIGATSYNISSSSSSGYYYDFSSGWVYNRQGPCPSGYHVPSYSDFSSLLGTWRSWKGTDIQEFLRQRKFPATNSYREIYLPTSTLSGSNSYTLFAAPTAPNGGYIGFTLNHGGGVRCFKN